MTVQFPDLYQGKISPPFNTQVLNDQGAHTETWEAYQQSLVDTLQSIITTDLKGVTDGSDAAAGDVGEYLTASASASLTSASTITVATLTLTAGDWDVTGSAVFHLSSTTASHFAVGVDSFGQEIIATIPSGTGTWRLSAGAPVRRNVTADTSVALVALCAFSGGSVSCDGVISARRMR